MRKVFRFFFAVLLLSPTILSPFSAPMAQVVLNEFMADPARDWDGDDEYNYRNDEWVEIINLGVAAVDLDGYRLADGEGEPVWRYGFSGLLEPGCVRVVYGSDSRAWEESFGFPVYGLSLNNTGDRISLYRIADGDTTIVDAFDYNDRAAEDDRSVGRGDQNTDVWAIYDAYNPCSENCDPAGNGFIPTPGLINRCMTAARDESWGSIKSYYAR